MTNNQDNHYVTKPRLRRNLTYTSVEEKSEGERRVQNNRVDKP